MEYWESYGITLKWLKYADIYPISHKIVTIGDKRIVYGVHKYAYAYVEHKEGITTIKIYQPYSQQYKWSSCQDHSVIALWTKIPYKGEVLVICSSMKDALCISCQLGIPAIATPGEGFRMSRTAIENLKERYGRNYVSFDTDEPGIRNTVRLSEETGFKAVIPDLGKCKDFSDYYKSLTDKRDFQRLKDLFV